MNEFRGDIRKRCKDESSLMEAWVRYQEIRWLIDDLAAIKKDVKINAARSPMKLPFSAENSQFDVQKRFQQLLRRHGACQLYYRIEEVVLRNAANGFGVITGGESRDPCIGQFADRSYCFVEIPSPISDVGSERYEDLTVHLKY